MKVNGYVELISKVKLSILAVMTVTPTQGSSIITSKLFETSVIVDVMAPFTYKLYVPTLLISVV